MQFRPAGAPTFVDLGFQVLGGAGNSWLDITGTFFVWGPLTPGADVNTWEQTVLASGAIPAAALGTVTHQGLLVDFANIVNGFSPTFTNATAFESL